MGERFFRWGFGLLALVSLVQPASADSISSLPGLNGLGAFTGTFTYTPTNATTATLVVQLTNTSSVGGGGYLTAFAFNNPGSHITGVTLSASNANFGLLGGSSFSNGINGAPYGHFDIGSSTGSSWEGGGAPSKGLGFGVTGTFTFALTGSGLDSLNVASFFSTLSVGPGDGEGLQAFVARFRGFTAQTRDGATSDKVRGALVPSDTGPSGSQVDPSTPEPGSLILAGITGVGVSIGWLRRRRCA